MGADSTTLDQHSHFAELSSQYLGVLMFLAQFKPDAFEYSMSEFVSSYWIFSFVFAPVLPFGEDC